MVIDAWVRIASNEVLARICLSVKCYLNNSNLYLYPQQRKLQLRRQSRRRHPRRWPRRSPRRQHPRRRQPRREERKNELKSYDAASTQKTSRWHDTQSLMFPNFSLFMIKTVKPNYHLSILSLMSNAVLMLIAQATCYMPISLSSCLQDDRSAVTLLPFDCAVFPWILLICLKIFTNWFILIGYPVYCA